MHARRLFRSRAVVMMLAGTAALGGCAASDAPHAPARTIDTALDVTTINGQKPFGELLPLQNVTTMIDTIDADGKRLVVTKGTRKAGTRVAIHVHKYGGHTCVMAGEITDFVEGQEPTKWPAGTCYYMPPDTLMAAANLGDEDAVLVDTFILPPGEPTITIREPGYPSN